MGGRNYAPRDGDRAGGGEEFGGRPRGGRPSMRPGSEGSVVRPNIDSSLPAMQNIKLDGPFNPLLLVPQPGPGGIIISNPNAPANDIAIWAHDDSVTPGKTYRYKMKVFFKNPLYGTVNLAKNPADAEKLWVETPWSEPSKEVTVPLTTVYYFTKANTNIKDNTVVSVTVDVAKKSKGQWQKESFTISPGDSVGATKGEIDYNTGKFIVDLRKEAGAKADTRIILCDESGNLEPLTIGNQPAAVIYDEIKKKINDAVPADGVGGTGVGGTGVGGAGAGGTGGAGGGGATPVIPRAGKAIDN
jgi:hypothetical protein